MTEDARFEDGGEGPLRLKAQDQEDLRIISSLVQDAVFPVAEMSWRPRQRRFAILLNRFRWEDAMGAAPRLRGFQRVQSVLVAESVLKVTSQGMDRRSKDLVMSLLNVAFTPHEDGMGDIVLTLAGDGALRLSVECLDLSLKDVTRPYVAPSGQAPRHA
ncbi:MAG: DUF2948 family protein [Pseudomonadota bacterium]